MNLIAATNLYNLSGRGETLHKSFDTLAHGLGNFRVALEVFDSFLQAAVDAVLVIEEVGGKFLEPFEVFFEDLLP